MKREDAKTQKELTAALQTLRLLVREVGGNYIAGLQADVARVERALAAAAEEGDAHAPHSAAEFRRMRRWINDLDVKPAKGRRRDLKELDRVITRLSATVENW